MVARSKHQNADRPANITATADSQEQRDTADIDTMSVASSDASESRMTDPMDTISVASSDASEGGMIDLMDNNATARIQTRARREKSREARLEPEENRGAQLVREMLGTTE